MLARQALRIRAFRLASVARAASDCASSHVLFPPPFSDAARPSRERGAHAGVHRCAALGAREQVRARRAHHERGALTALAAGFSAERLAAGAVIALGVAFIARRARTLTSDGAIAAWLVGTLAIAASARWGVLLISYFVTASALSRLGAARKAARTQRVVEKAGARDARQVAANGGVFALAALGHVLAPSPLWLVFGAGALAASASDTWATEVGTLAGGEPRIIVGWRTVAPGTSGAVSLPGTLASVAGAAFIALLGRFADLSAAEAWTVLVGGVAGSLADSLLGATVQERRWCDRCKESTERTVHSCGAETRIVGGVPRLDNDAVNLITGAVGGIVSVLIASAA